MPITRGKDKRWRYRQVVMLPDGTRKRISGSAPNYCNTKAACAQALQDHIQRLRYPFNQNHEEEETTEPKPPTVREFAQTYLEASQLKNKPSTVAAKERILRCHVLPLYAECTLDAIDYGAIEDLKIELGQKKLAPKTINNVLTVVRRMLAIAYKRGLIESVPEIEWLKAPPPAFDFLRFEEADQLVDAAEPAWRTMILVALRTGLRQGELLGLRQEDVDLRAGRLWVCQSIVQGNIVTPKSGKSREVPLGNDVLAALKSHRHKHGPYVFCDDKGEPLTSDMCKAPLRRAIRAADLRHLGWHVLRHTFASHLVMRGVSLKVVQELMGHATITMTMRYAHLAPEVKRDAVRLLDSTSRGKHMAKPNEDEPN